METRKKSSQKGKDATVNRSERGRVTDQVTQMLEEHKKRMGEVVCVVIDHRTSIELPASMTPEERSEHVKNYKKNMNVKPVK